jgi:hypothetical protein
MIGPWRRHMRRTKPAGGATPVLAQRRSRNTPFVSDLETPTSAFSSSARRRAPSSSRALSTASGWGATPSRGHVRLARYQHGILTIEDRGVGAGGLHDPFAASPPNCSRRSAPASGGLPPLAGGLVGYFAYDPCATWVPPDAPPDDLAPPGWPSSSPTRCSSLTT